MLILIKRATFINIININFVEAKNNLSKIKLNWNLRLIDKVFNRLKAYFKFFLI